MPELRVDEELDISNAHVKMKGYLDLSYIKEPPIGYIGQHRKEDKS